MRWERLAGLNFELLHGIHELELVLGVLLFEGGRVDPASPFLAGPPLFRDPRKGGIGVGTSVGDRAVSVSVSVLVANLLRRSGPRRS